MNSRITSPTVCSLVSNDFLNNVLEIRSLGRGTYGSVYLVEKPDGQRYAIKYMNNYPEIDDLGVSQSALLDIDALLRLRNVRDVIDVIGVCYQTDGSNPNRIALILEAMDDDLRKFIDLTTVYDRLTLAPRLLQIMIRVAALMETLNISHFDIKPQNILVRGSGTNAVFKVTDFGLAKATFGSNVVPRDELFTLWYRPPEFLADRDRSTFRIFAGDIWAIATTVIEFITGHPLFPGKSVWNMLQLIYRDFNPVVSQTQEQFNNANKFGIITGQLSAMELITRYISRPQAEQLNSQIINMLSRMFSLNPNVRPSGIQLLDEFNERINPDFLSTLLPPSYPRRIQARGIDVITRVCEAMRLSKATTLITLEIFTRYLDTLTIDLEHNSNIDARALGTVRIAAVFAENITYETYEVRDAYQVICGLTCSPIDNLQIAEMEKEILHKIDFQIYNLNLGPVIERAYSKNINIRGVNPTQFAEPLVRWLIE